MSEYTDFGQAAEALAAAVNAPEGAPETPVQPNQPVAPTTNEGDQGDQGGEQFDFTPSKDIDLSGLDDVGRDYVLAREKEMQAAFTRKMQETADVRKEAEQAQQFLEQLNSNPFFAQQVVQEISAQLQQAGFTPAEANQLANQQVGNDPSGNQTQAPYADEYGDDPYFQELRRLEAQQNQLQHTLETQQQAARQQSLEAQLTNMAATIRTQNPTFEDADMDRIFRMSYAYDGDLYKAADDFKAINQSAVERYLAQKESVPASLNQPRVTGAALTPPEGFKGLDDPNLEAAAQRMLNEALGG